MSADTRRRRRPFLVAIGLVLAALGIGCGEHRGGATPEQHDVGVDRAVTSPAVVALISHSAPAEALLGGFRCSGVLEAPDRVLTARHCVAGVAPDNLDVVTGVDDLCTPLPASAERRPVRRIRRSAHLDLAVIELVRPVMAAPARFALSAPSATSRLVAVGWGRMRTAEDPCRRAVAQLALAPEDDCAAAVALLRRQARPVQICALPRVGRNTCAGDSGGPLFDVTSGVPTVVGVTSAGVGGCHTDDIGLYVKVGGGR